MSTQPKTYSAGQTGAFKPAQPAEMLTDAASSAIDSVKSTVGDVVDRGQAAFSQASAAANEMAGSAKPQVTTFASELEKMTRRNPLGRVGRISYRCHHQSLLTSCYFSLALGRSFFCETS